MTPIIEQAREASFPAVAACTGARVARVAMRRIMDRRRSAETASEANRSQRVKAPHSPLSGGVTRALQCARGGPTTEMSHHPSAAAWKADTHSLAVALVECTAVGLPRTATPRNWNLSRSSAWPALDPSRPAPGTGPGCGTRTTRTVRALPRAGHRAARTKAATRPGWAWSALIRRALPQSDGRPAGTGRPRQ